MDSFIGLTHSTVFDTQKKHRALVSSALLKIQKYNLFFDKLVSEDEKWVVIMLLSKDNGYPWPKPTVIGQRRITSEKSVDRCAVKRIT